jgi:uncharacterized protein
MRVVFADANYWVALANPEDDLYEKATQATQELGSVHLLTTDLVLTEFLNHYSRHGAQMREFVAEWVEDILLDPNVDVQFADEELFRAGVQLYRDRSDKDYGLNGLRLNGGDA